MNAQPPQVAAITNRGPHTRRANRRLKRWRRTALLAVVAATLAALLVPTVLGTITTLGLVYGQCTGQGRTPATFGYTAWDDITFTMSGGASVRAFFLHGTNRATIIIPPTLNGDRGSRLHIADILARNGYGVLTYESRRCAGMGPLSLGYKEAADVGDALAYLRTRPDVDPACIGVLGFSSAGAAALMAAAHYPDLGAVVAEGNYDDFADGALRLRAADGTILEKIYKRAVSISYHLVTGVDIDRLSPVDVIDQIAPRPILLVYGSRESSLRGGRALLAAAGQNATLWVVEGAGHGDYPVVAPAAYEQRVVAFFDAALVSNARFTDEDTHP